MTSSMNEIEEARNIISDKYLIRSYIANKLQKNMEVKTMMYTEKKKQPRRFIDEIYCKDNKFILSKKAWLI
jgi:hypothetical protein